MLTDLRLSMLDIYFEWRMRRKVITNKKHKQNWRWCVRQWKSRDSFSFHDTTTTAKMSRFPLIEFNLLSLISHLFMLFSVSCPQSTIDKSLTTFVSYRLHLHMRHITRNPFVEVNRVHKNGNCFSVGWRGRMRFNLLIRACNYTHEFEPRRHWSTFSLTFWLIESELRLEETCEFAWASELRKNKINTQQFFFIGIMNIKSVCRLNESPEQREDAYGSHRWTFWHSENLIHTQERRVLAAAVLASNRLIMNSKAIHSHLLVDAFFPLLIIFFCHVTFVIRHRARDRCAPFWDKRHSTHNRFAKDTLNCLFLLKWIESIFATCECHRGQREWRHLAEELRYVCGDR